MKRVLFVLAFLAVWLGSLWLYVSSASGSPRETVLLVISGFWLAVFFLLGRKLFKAKLTDIGAAPVIAQLTNLDLDD